MSQEIKDAIRAAGGIVHRDGNIFFTDDAQFLEAFRLIYKPAADRFTDHHQKLVLAEGQLFTTYHDRPETTIAVIPETLGIGDDAWNLRETIDEICRRFNEFPAMEAELQAQRLNTTKKANDA